MGRAGYSHNSLVLSYLSHDLELIGSFTISLCLLPHQPLCMVIHEILRLLSKSRQRRLLGSYLLGCA